MGTIMSGSADCPWDHADGETRRNVHTRGMVGGGWRVEGVGGATQLTLEVQPDPMNGRTVRIVIDRQGHVAEVSR